MHWKRQLEHLDSSLLSQGTTGDTTQTNFPHPHATGQHSVLSTRQDNRVKWMFGLLSPFLGFKSHLLPLHLQHPACCRLASREPSKENCQ